MPDSAIPSYITSLIRHFEDLRDGTHGGSASRKDTDANSRQKWARVKAETEAAIFDLTDVLELGGDAGDAAQAATGLQLELDTLFRAQVVRGGK